MSQNLKPARVVPPGRILERELEARGWTQRDLAEIMGRPTQTISEIVRGVKQITPETALELAAAFGTSPEFWTNLEANYRLNLARKEKNGKNNIARKSRLFSLAPVRELVKRGWIKKSERIEELEREVALFLEIALQDEGPAPAALFRHSRERGPETNAQIAWIKRVEHLARAQPVAEFDVERLRKAIPQILSYSAEAEHAARVPETLLGLGLHFVLVPHLPKTFIDGALLSTGGCPIVALTLRYDRIDAFWFTLMHELAHVVLGHERPHLETLEEGGDEADEAEANLRAREWLVPSDAFDAFVAKAGPHFSRAEIEEFARQIGRHPGIVLGRLQYEGLVGYGHLRRLLVRVSDFLVDWVDVPMSQRAYSR